MEATLAVAAAAWAIAMALGPVLQIRKLIEHKNSDSISVGYFLVLFRRVRPLGPYGVAASNLALIVPNTVAALVIVVTILVALHYREAR